MSLNGVNLEINFISILQKEILDILFNFADRGFLRVDTIIWETNDSRYPRNQTNSGEKLNVLYYLQLRNILSNMWGEKTSWHIYSDQQN